MTDGGTGDKGATTAKERVSLIADGRSDSTMPHEAGHFLGALTAEGKYDSEYGHPEKSQEMLGNSTVDRPGVGRVAQTGKRALEQEQ